MIRVSAGGKDDPVDIRPVWYFQNTGLSTGIVAKILTVTCRIDLHLVAIGSRLSQDTLA